MLQTRKEGKVIADQTFRGQPKGVVDISNHAWKDDWWLVPRDQEAEFCVVTDVHPDPPPAPSQLPCPPMLELWLKQEMKQKGEPVTDEPILINFVPNVYDPDYKYWEEFPDDSKSWGFDLKAYWKKGTP